MIFRKMTNIMCIALGVLGVRGVLADLLRLLKEKKSIN